MAGEDDPGAALDSPEQPGQQAGPEVEQGEPDGTLNEASGDSMADETVLDPLQERVAVEVQEILRNIKDPVLRNIAQGPLERIKRSEIQESWKRNRELPARRKEAGGS